MKEVLRFRNIIILVFILILVNSCSLLRPSYASANYTLQEPNSFPYVDISQGTWAIYDIDAAYNVAAEIDKEVYNDFHGLLGNRLIDAQLDDELLIDKSLNANEFDKETLEQLAETSKVDYIILIKVKEGKETYRNELNKSHNELDKDSRPYVSVYNRDGYANIKIYDLKKAELIFNRSCNATLEIEDKQPIDFSPSQEKMLKKAYKKLFKSFKSETIN